MNSDQWVSASMGRKWKWMGNGIIHIRKQSEYVPHGKGSSYCIKPVSLTRWHSLLWYSCLVIEPGLRKFTVLWVQVNPVMDLLGWRMYVSLASWELAHLLFGECQFPLQWVFKSKSSRKRRKKTTDPPLRSEGSWRMRTKESKVENFNILTLPPRQMLWVFLTL